MGDAGAHCPGDQEPGAAGALRGTEGPGRPGEENGARAVRAVQPSGKKDHRATGRVQDLRGENGAAGF